MKCHYYKCQHRAEKYLLNKVRVLGMQAFDARAHAYCKSHWDKVYRRYWL